MFYRSVLKMRTIAFLLKKRAAASQQAENKEKEEDVLAHRQNYEMNLPIC